MTDVSTVALNMTFLVTLGIGFLIFLAHVLIFAAILMLAGAARLTALAFAALFNWLLTVEALNLKSSTHDREARPARAFSNFGQDAQ